MDRASRKSTRAAAPLRAVPPPYGFFTVPKCVPCCWEPPGARARAPVACARHLVDAAALPRVALGAPQALCCIDAACNLPRLRPRFRLVPAAEALMGLLFANLFWVGLWDLLDTTIFPFDSSYAMLLLVRRLLPPLLRRLGRGVAVCCMWPGTLR